MGKLVRESLKDKLRGPSEEEVYQKLKARFEERNEDQVTPLEFYENSSELSRLDIAKKFFTRYFQENPIPHMPAHEIIYFGKLTNNEKLLDEGISELVEECDDLVYLTPKDKDFIKESGIYLKVDPESFSEIYSPDDRPIIEEFIKGTEPDIFGSFESTPILYLEDTFWEFINEKNLKYLANEILPGLEGEYQDEEVQLTKENISIENGKIFIKIGDQKKNLIDFLNETQDQPGEFKDLARQLQLTYDTVQEMETANKIMEDILKEIRSKIGEPIFTEEGLIINVTDFIQRVINHDAEEIFRDEYSEFIGYMDVYFSDLSVPRPDIKEAPFGFHGEHSDKNFNEELQFRLEELKEEY